MFQFTTTNVINSNLDSSGKKRWNYDADNGTFNVLRVHNFEKDNVEAVYIAEPIEGVNEEIVINFKKLESDVEKNDQLCLNLYIGLTQASQDSRYSNDLIYKGKPFTVEFVWKDSVANTLTALKKTIDKYQVLVYGDKQLDAELDGETLIIRAKTEYQRFKKVEVAKYEPDTTQYPYSGQYTILADLEDAVVIEKGDDTTDTSNATIILSKGQESFGTFDYIMHNLRLPTFENTRVFGVQLDEAPMVGATYVQVVIHYCKRRGPLGTNAVGDLVTSKTTHVFYVLADIAADFIVSLNAGLDLDIELPSTNNKDLVGDINGDNKVDIADLNALLDILLKRGSQGSPKKVSRKA